MPYARVYLGECGHQSRHCLRLDHAPTILHLATHALDYGTEAGPGGSEAERPASRQAPESPVPDFAAAVGAPAPVGTEHGLGRPDSTGQGPRPSARRGATVPGPARPSRRGSSVEPTRLPYDGLATALRRVRPPTTFRNQARRTRRLQAARGVIWRQAASPDCAAPSLVAGAEASSPPLWPVSDGVTN